MEGIGNLTMFGSCLLFGLIISSIVILKAKSDSGIDLITLTLSVLVIAVFFLLALVFITPFVEIWFEATFGQWFIY